MPLTQSFSFSSSQLWQDTPSDQNALCNKGDALRRVTIRQLLKATPGSSDPLFRFQIDGIGVRRVMLVANVCGERTETSGKFYEFDDGTGRIRGNWWSASHDAYDPFTYVRVVGELDQFNDSYNLKLTHVQPVFDAYEVYSHILGAIGDTLMLERGPPPRNWVPEDHTTNNSVQYEEPDTLSQVLHNTSISPEMNRPTTRSDTRRPRYRTKVDRAFTSIVLDLADDDDDAEGVHIEDILEKLRAIYPSVASEDVKDAVEYLLTETFIAAGQDDYHYRPGARFRSTI